MTNKTFWPFDENMMLASAYSYDEFGNLVSETSTVEQPYKFSTKRYYAGLGLNYYGYRFYSASLGRWMTRDPLGEAGGLNLYGAMGNSPVNWVDPLGLVSGDKTYGLPPEFWSWYHRKIKKPGDPDITKEEALKYYDEWKELNKPGPDAKRGGRHGKRRCRIKGLKGLAGLDVLIMGVDIYEAQKIADKYGVSVWYVLNLQMMGYDAEKELEKNGI